MTLRGTFGKVKIFLFSHGKDEQDRRQPTEINRPHNSWSRNLHRLGALNIKSSSSKADHAATLPQIVITPPDEIPAITDLTNDAVPTHPPVQSNPTPGHGPPPSFISLHSLNTQAKNSSPSPPPPQPSHDKAQEVSATADAQTIQSATFREGSFANAQGVYIGTAVMIDSEKTEEERRTQEEKRAEKERRAEEERQAANALEKLATKGMPSAMLDSIDRGYVPRCNEDTRQTLRHRIVTWCRQGEEIRRVLWLSGPAGIGKSAVAQTVAEELKGKRLFGGGFFFSRPNNRSNPNVVIPTLAYQLATHIPEYRRIIAHKIIQDPVILDRSRATQFQELIIDPFVTLLTQHPASPPTPHNRH